MDEKPRIVVIDDNPEQTELLLAGPADECTFEVIDIAAIIDGTALGALEDATVILVDHELLPLKDEPPPTAMNGLALIGVLRQYLSKANRQPLLALYTSDTDLVPATSGRSPSLARTHAFDWAFAKTDGDAAGLGKSLAALANAAQRLSDAFGSNPTTEFDDLDSNIDRLRVALALPQAPWAAAAGRELAAAQPPVFSTDESVDPDQVRHWLLHRILPYPTFILDTNRAGARLGLPQVEFESLLETGLRERFDSVQYTGVLARFGSRRYWRSGIDHLARELAGGFDTQALQSALELAAGRPLPFVNHPRPVVALDRHLQPLATPILPSESVRIHVDGWPAYAEPPRILRTEIVTSELRNMVVSDDQELLDVGPQ